MDGLLEAEIPAMKSPENGPSFSTFSSVQFSVAKGREGKRREDGDAMLHDVVAKDGQGVSGILM